MNNLFIGDHLNGFNSEFNNTMLKDINEQATETKIVYTNYILDNRVKKMYPKLDLRFSTEKYYNIIEDPSKFVSTKKKTFENFVCSFNGSGTIARQFLISAMHKFKWIREDYFTKNFECFKDRIDGNISSFFDNPEQTRFYRKFLIGDNQEEFYKQIISIDYKQFNHLHNISVLENSISTSFLQLIGETEGTSYVPYYTEKFMYPIVCKTLYICYAQPNWYTGLEKYFGFKKYEKIFDYSFDNIQNPVIRLVEIMTMLSKFEKLSKLDWHDLYLIEQDTIEYNYEWCKSKKYLEKIKEYE
jgi:hypothetical protein